MILPFSLFCEMTDSLQITVVEAKHFQKTLFVDTVGYMPPIHGILIIVCVFPRRTLVYVDELIAVTGCSFTGKYADDTKNI